MRAIAKTAVGKFAPVSGQHGGTRATRAATRLRARGVERGRAVTRLLIKGVECATWPPVPARRRATLPRVIRVHWTVDGVGGGESWAVSMDAVPGAVERIITESLKRYAPGFVAGSLSRMLAPVIAVLLSDVRSDIEKCGRWEFRADGFHLVAEEVPDGTFPQVRA